MEKLFKTLSLLLFIPLLHFATVAVYPGFAKIRIPHLLMIYGILAMLTGVHLFVVRTIVRRHHEQSAIIVMGLNMLKMILSIVLLFVVVVPFAGKGGAVAINFGLAYFFFLIFDSKIVIMLLNSKE